MTRVPVSALRLLVCHSEGQQEIFRITPEKIEAALARAPASLPPVQVEFRTVGDPDLADRLAESHALLGWQIPRDLVCRTRGVLRLIQLTGAGVEHLAPIDWLPDGVTLTNASGIHGAKLQEWAVMVLLMLHTHMPHFISAQRAHVWSKRHSSVIAGKRALIYGTGGIGKAVARAARQLGVTTIGVRRHPAPIDVFDAVVGREEADGQLYDADFVVFAMPLTAETYAHGNATFFARMKPGAGFINFGRGGLVVQEDLAAALESQALGGAVVDVATPEPLPEASLFWDVPGLIITPHVSCDDPATYIPDVLDLLLDNMDRQNSRELVRNRVDPARTY